MLCDWGKVSCPSLGCKREQAPLSSQRCCVMRVQRVTSPYGRSVGGAGGNSAPP